MSATATPLVNPPPVDRPSAAATPLVAAVNPLRKQTLLGIAPAGTATPSQPPSATTEAEPATFTPAPEPPPVGAPLVAPSATNPRRAQTLLGLAPAAAAEVAKAAAERASEATTSPVASPAPLEATASEATSDDAAAESAASPSELMPVAADAQSYSSLATATPTKTDAPITSDITPSAERRAGASAARPALVDSSSADDLPELRKSRSRWLLPVGVAAALALGVVGLRSLDRAPTKPPAGAERPVATPGNPALSDKPIKKASDDDGDDASDPGDNTGPTSAPDAEPLKGAAKPADAAASAAAPSPTPSAVAEAPSAAPAAPSAAPSGDVVRINVDSDPPGARLFWKGKEVGTTPFVLSLAPGERHAYELGLPGHITRKVVIDGSKTEIKIGLRPDPNASSGISNRKH